MPRAEPDELLRQLAEIQEAGREDLPGDDLLRAFAAGELPPHEEAQVALRIADSPAARERLARLAGIDLPGPRAATRRRVLAASGTEAPRGRLAAGWRWSLAAAAVLAGVLAWPLIDRSRPMPELQDRYELEAHGRVDSRSSHPPGAPAGFVPAGRGDEVTIRVVRRGTQDLSPRFTLYLLQGDRLQKAREIPAGPRAATLRILAEELVGPTAGRQDHLLVAVVSQPEDPLPETVRIEPGQDPVEALAAGKSRVALPLSLVPPGSPDAGDSP